MNEYVTLDTLHGRKSSRKYTTGFRLAAIDIVIENPQISITQISKNIGIPQQTLSRWWNDYKKECISINYETASDLLTKQQLFWVRETLGASEKDKVKYCRKYGIVYQKLMEWTELYKDERYQKQFQEVQNVNKRNKEIDVKLKEENIELKKKVKELEKKLKVSEKEKDRAEALLELKKKFDQLMSEDIKEDD